MKALIKVGVVLNLLIGLGHLLCMAALDKIFAIYGISDVMDRIAQYGTYLPYVITIIIAVAFFVVALYGMSALKAIPRLPFADHSYVDYSYSLFGPCNLGTYDACTAFYVARIIIDNRCAVACSMLPAVSV